MVTNSHVSTSYYHSPANVSHRWGWGGGWGGGGAVLVITIHWLIFHTHWGQGDGGVTNSHVSTSYYHSLANVSRSKGIAKIYLSVTIITDV